MARTPPPPVRRAPPPARRTPPDAVNARETPATPPAATTPPDTTPPPVTAPLGQPETPPGRTGPPPCVSCGTPAQCSDVDGTERCRGCVSWNAPDREDVYAAHAARVRARDALDAA